MFFPLATTLKGMKHSVDYRFAYRKVYESEKGIVWREIRHF